MKTLFILLFVAFVFIIYTAFILLFPIIYSANLYKTIPTKNTEKSYFEINSSQSKLLRVAVIGDSTAIGQGTSSVQESFSYQYLVQNSKFQDYKIEYTNYAVSGVRIKEVIDKQLVFEPVDLIFVSIGANDVTQMTSQNDFQNSVATLTGKLQTLAKNVIWINIPDFVTVPVFLPPLNYLASNRTQSFDKIIQNTTSKTSQINLIDVYNLAREPFRINPDKYFSKDKFHPSKDGYKIWVDLIGNSAKD